MTTATETTAPAPTAAAPLKVWACAWCQGAFSNRGHFWPAPAGKYHNSHGMCPTCAAAMKREAEELLGREVLNTQPTAA